jgi:hypothetical protein
MQRALLAIIVGIVGYSHADRAFDNGLAQLMLPRGIGDG